MSGTHCLSFRGSRVLGIQECLVLETMSVGQGEPRSEAGVQEVWGRLNTREIPNLAFTSIVTVCLHCFFKKCVYVFDCVQS